MASIEWIYPRLIDFARSASAAPLDPSGSDTAPPTRTMRGGNDAYNDRQVAKGAHLSVAELLREFADHRAATIKAVEDADEQLFSRRIRSAPRRDSA